MTFKMPGDASPFKGMQPGKWVWVWKNGEWQGPIDQNVVLMQLRDGALASETLVRNERGKTFRAEELGRCPTYDWAYGLACFALSLSCAGPLSLFMLFAGRLNDGELRHTTDERIRTSATVTAFLPCALAFAFYVAAIVFA